MQTNLTPPTAPATKAAPRAAIYIRVSTDSQEDNYSLGSQEAECRAFAEARGYDVARVYRDVHSGFELEERPQVKAMREAVRRGEVHAVIAYALDRLSRKQTHTGIIADDCERAGVELLFVTEEFEKSAVGTFIRNAKAFAAEIEREKFKERSARGRASRTAAGKRTAGAHPLYGYQWDDASRGAKNRLVENPDTAPILRRIFSDVAAGSSLRALANRLNAEGVPSPTGRALWNSTTLRYFIHHDDYTGSNSTAPQLVDAATVTACRAALARNKATSTRANREPERFLLRAGHIYCGECGQAVHTAWTSTEGGRYKATPIYRVTRAANTHQECSQASIRAEIVDEAVWDKMLAIIFSPELELARALREPDDDTTAVDLATTDKALAAIARKQTNLIRELAKIDDEDTAAIVRANLAPLSEQKAGWERERAAILARRAEWEAARAQRAHIIAWCQELRAKLADPEMIGRNDAGELVVRDVEVFDFIARNVVKRLQLRNVPYERKRAVLALFNVKVILHRADHKPRYEIFAHINLTSTLTAYYFPECPTESLCIDSETGERFILGRAREVVNRTP